MKESKPLVNRVANSGLITLNLEDFYPKGDIVGFDLKAYLFRELILREKDFRESMKEHDWTQYEGKNLAIFCSTDAIIPVWAYQLVALNAAPYANRIVQGTPDMLVVVHYYDVLGRMELEQYQDQRIVIKGCSNKPVPPAAYAELARRLQPFAKSIMYGEPCSTVPLFKKPRKAAPKKA